MRHDTNMARIPIPVLHLSLLQRAQSEDGPITSRNTVEGFPEVIIAKHLYNIEVTIGIQDKNINSRKVIVTFNQVFNYF